MDNIKPNGKPKNASNLDEKKIEFPVTFNLKAVMAGTDSNASNKEKVESVFDKLGVKHSYNDKKVSSKGTYTSFTFEVTLNSREKMDALYDALKNVDGLKFAL